MRFNQNLLVMNITKLNYLLQWKRFTLFDWPFTVLPTYLQVSAGNFKKRLVWSFADSRLWTGIVGLLTLVILCKKDYFSLYFVQTATGRHDNKFLLRMTTFTKWLTNSQIPLSNVNLSPLLHSRHGCWNKTLSHETKHVGITFMSENLDDVALC